MRKVRSIMNRTEKLAELYPEDILRYSDQLTDKEVDLLVELRKVLEEKLEPVLEEHWKNETFPLAEFKSVIDLGLMDHPDLFIGREGEHKVSEYFNMYRLYELARTDTSLATFFAVHAGLGYTTLLLGGSEEQIAYYGPKLASFEMQTCFALTEPEHGSDIAGGITTTAVHEGDSWVINGEKRWIGGAGTADVIPVFAKNPETKEILCFMVPGDADGLSVEKIDGKIALRLVQNGHITLENVTVSDETRLPNITSFKDVSKILYTTRGDVTHIASGTHAGALKSALEYADSREQFGRSITQFQLIQEKLARMEGNVVTALGLSYRLATLQAAGEFAEVPASIAKMQTARLLRETAALAREIAGGNGITVEHKVAKFFGDAEAIYSYEGTHEINSLIIGRHLTGKGAFV